jgi:hypothetical protein
MSNISENGSCDTATIQSTLYFDSKIDNGEDSEMNGDETSQKHDYQAALDRIGWQENIVAVKSEYRISRKEIDIRLNHKQSSNNANDSDIGNPENDKNENNESRENRDSQYSKSGRYKNKRPRDNAGEFHNLTVLSIAITTSSLYVDDYPYTYNQSYIYLNLRLFT